MSAKKEKLIMFEGWFSIVLPEQWEYEKDEDVIDFYLANKNAKGALQVSLYKIKEQDLPVDEMMADNLKLFIKKNSIEIDENTFKIIEGPNMTFANVIGKLGGILLKFGHWAKAIKCYL